MARRNRWKGSSTGRDAQIRANGSTCLGPANGEWCLERGRVAVIVRSSTRSSALAPIAKKRNDESCSGAFSKKRQGDMRPDQLGRLRHEQPLGG